LVAYAAMTGHAHDTTVDPEHAVSPPTTTVVGSRKVGIGSLSVTL
jgi:hypothetical protein